MNDCSIGRRINFSLKPQVKKSMGVPENQYGRCRECGNICSSPERVQILKRIGTRREIIGRTERDRRGSREACLMG